MKKRMDKVQSRLKNKKKKEKEEPVLSEDSAMDQICVLLDYYDIEMSRLEAIGEQGTAAGENTLDALITYFRYGKLKLQNAEKGMKVIQTLRTGSTITYSEINAQMKRTMDKLESKEHYGKIHIFMGALGNIGLDGVDQLHATDLAVLEVLGSLFLLV